MTLEADGSKAVWGSLGPDNIHVKIQEGPNGLLTLDGTVGPFTWKQTIEPVTQQPPAQTEKCWLERLWQRLTD